MDRATANKLYRNHAGAMAYGEVSENGDRKIGTAFHVGSGVFLTARHVVERTKIIQYTQRNICFCRRKKLIPSSRRSKSNKGLGAIHLFSKKP